MLKIDQTIFRQRRWKNGPILSLGPSFGQVQDEPRGLESSLPPLQAQCQIPKMIFLDSFSLWFCTDSTMATHY